MTAVLLYRDEVQQQLVERLQQILAQGDQFEPGQISAVSTFIARMMTRPESKIVINRMLIEQVRRKVCSLLTVILKETSVLLFFH